MILLDFTIDDLQEAYDSYSPSLALMYAQITTLFDGKQPFVVNEPKSN